MTRYSMILGLMLAAPAGSQTPTPPPAPPRPGAPMTLDRFIARHTERMMAADTDGDGRISRMEMAAAPARDGDPSRRFDRMDANHDGYVDRDEIRAGLTRRFQKMDLNGDGMLSADERMAAKARHTPAGPNSDAAVPAPRQP